MRLNELIAALNSVPAKTPVKFSDGTYPSDFGSWRGVYAQLTLYPDGKSNVTAGELLKKARAADGGTFSGYKGGDYRMDGDTTVWADGWGDCDYYGIVGASREVPTKPESPLVLQRACLESYRDW